MFVDIEKARFERDPAGAESESVSHFEPAARWHPALRLMIIIGGAGSLWALLLGVFP